MNLNEIKSFAPFCLSCLGRTCGKVGFGLDNRERGMEILNQLEIQNNVDLNEELISEGSNCKICDGLISEIPNFVNLVTASISDYSISSFKIGTIVDKDLLSNEASFQSIFGEGIGVWKATDLEAQMDNPHAVAIIDTSYDTIDLEI